MTCSKQAYFSFKYLYFKKGAVKPLFFIKFCKQDKVQFFAKLKKTLYMGFQGSYSLFLDLSYYVLLFNTEISRVKCEVYEAAPCYEDFLFTVLKNEYGLETFLKR